MAKKWKFLEFFQHFRKIEILKKRNAVESMELWCSFYSMILPLESWTGQTHSIRGSRPVPLGCTWDSMNRYVKKETQFIMVDDLWTRIKWMSSKTFKNGVTYLSNHHFYLFLCFSYPFTFGLFKCRGSLTKILELCCLLIYVSQILCLVVIRLRRCCCSFQNDNIKSKYNE